MVYTIRVRLGSLDTSAPRRTATRSPKAAAGALCWQGRMHARVRFPSWTAFFDLFSLQTCSAPRMLLLSIAGHFALPWRSATSPGVKPTPFSTVTVSYGNERYSVYVQEAADSKLPPLLLIPPVGVGIDKSFYNRLQSEWQLLNVPAAMHAPDLLGTGSATPKPRRFYSPAVWAEQLGACACPPSQS